MNGKFGNQIIIDQTSLIHKASERPGIEAKIKKGLACVRKDLTNHEENAQIHLEIAADKIN